MTSPAFLQYFDLVNEVRHEFSGYIDMHDEGVTYSKFHEFMRFKASTFFLEVFPRNYFQVPDHKDVVQVTNWLHVFPDLLQDGEKPLFDLLSDRLTACLIEECASIFSKQFDNYDETDFISAVKLALARRLIAPAQPNSIYSYKDRMMWAVFSIPVEVHKQYMDLVMPHLKFLHEREMKDCAYNIRSAPIARGLEKAISWLSFTCREKEGYAEQVKSRFEASKFLKFTAT